MLHEEGFAELMGEEFDRIQFVIGNWEGLMNGDAYERAVGKSGEEGDRRGSRTSQTGSPRRTCR